VVVGGGAAGMSAASAARRVDPSLPIVVLEATGHAAYGLCGLPYPPVRRGRGGRPLLLPARLLPRSAASTSASARRPPGSTSPPARSPAPSTVGSSGSIRRAGRRRRWERRAAADRGLAGRRVFTVRTIEDNSALRELLDADAVRTAVGRRARLHRAGDRRGAARARGGDDRRRAAAAGAAHRSTSRSRRWWRRTSASTSTCGLATDADAALAEVDPDVVVVCTGVRPAGGIAAAAGAETGPGGALLVDERMRTSLPDVYARGTASRRGTACSAGPPTSRWARRPTRPDGWRARSRRAATRRSRASSARPW
jgi:hypothetical protein